MLSPEEHTHVTTGGALFGIGCFAAFILGTCGLIYLVYPDRPSAPRTFPGGLERELGGPNAVRVSGPTMFRSLAFTNCKKARSDDDLD